MSRPRDIRSNLIVPNKAELERYGILRSSNANSGKRGRPAWVYYLNREQANLVSIFSRTEKAADVREELIKVFSAYQDGHLTLSETGKVAIPDFANPAAAARAWAEVWETSQKDRAAVETHLEFLTFLYCGQVASQPERSFRFLHHPSLHKQL